MKLGILLLASVLLLIGCGGVRGDKPIAVGDGLGLNWKPAAPKQMRIAVENSFTRDVFVSLTAPGNPGAHYEFKVGPVRERYIIVPEANYEIKAWTHGEIAGLKLHVIGEPQKGGKALRVKVRP